MAQSLGFNETAVGHASIVVTELATNLVKYAGGGELLLRHLEEGEASGLEILSLDKGLGIGNVAESLRDGYSTSGSPGTGLGAIQRLSTLFDIQSRPGNGTAVLSQLWPHGLPASSPERPVRLGGVCVPVSGEEFCGDFWSVRQTRERVQVFLADGLGHGQFAAEASGLAARVFEGHADCPPAKLLELMHQALRSTRGAAVAVAELDLRQRLVRYAAVGNTSGRLLSPEGSRSMVSHHGTVGLTVRKLEEFTYPWPEDCLLVMHSDGLATSWEFDDRPGLRGRHPALIAGVLFRDHQRDRDDCAVVVLGEARSTS
jgi:anti-sigma regulatory factor (Ser/Thr protein kinase)